MSGRQIDISANSLSVSFVQIPDCIGDIPMTSDAFRLAYLILRDTWRYRTAHKSVSARWVAGCLGGGEPRAQKAKKDLCAAVPTVFSLIPGSSAKRRADVIVVDRNALLLLHAQHVAAREAEKAASHGTEAVQVILEVGGHRHLISGNSAEPRQELEPAYEIPRSAPTPRVARELSTPPTQPLRNAVTRKGPAKKALRSDDPRHQQLAAVYEAHRGALPGQDVDGEGTIIVSAALARLMDSRVLGLFGLEGGLEKVRRATLYAAAEARREPGGWVDRVTTLERVICEADRWSRLYREPGATRRPATTQQNQYVPADVL